MIGTSFALTVFLPQGITSPVLLNLLPEGLVEGKGTDLTYEESSGLGGRFSRRKGGLEHVFHRFFSKEAPRQRRPCP